MKKTRIILLTALLVSTLGACKKEYLNTAPTDQVDNSAVFTTVENANVALNGVYRYLFERYSGQNQPGVGGVMLAVDFMGDDLSTATRSSWFPAEADWTSFRQETSATVSYHYRLFYRVIGNVNYVIDNIDAASGSDADKKRVKAEALTLRAWAHFYLVQFFGKRYDAATKPNTQLGIPLMLSSTENSKPRATVEEVYTAINKDLDDAIALNVTTRVNKSHINVWVAKGIKARVALTQQDYATAITYAKQVIDGGAFPLMYLLITKPVSTMQP